MIKEFSVWTRALGWFSVLLGIPPLAAPDRFARAAGAGDERVDITVARLAGLRELAVGSALVAWPRRPGLLWGRVVGDVIDLALLAGLRRRRSTNRGRVTSALLAVVGITALDLYVATGARKRRVGQVTSAELANGIVVRQAITIDRPPDVVYTYWRALENLPRFMGHLESVTVTDVRRSQWIAKAPAGTTVAWEAEITEDRPSERIAWRSLPASSVANEGEVRFAPAPGNRGTEVVVELRYNPPVGEIGAAIAKLFGEAPEQQVRDGLRALKQVLEVGEVIYSDASYAGRPHPARPAH